MFDKIFNFFNRKKQHYEPVPEPMEDENEELFIEPVAPPSKYKDQIFEAYGLKCFIAKNHLDVWAGYVGVESNHPLYKKTIYDECEVLQKNLDIIRMNGVNDSNFDEFMTMARFASLMLGEGLKPIPSIVFEVHGGVTFAGHISAKETKLVIGMSKDLWWFGFHCGHPGDIIPGINKNISIHSNNIIPSTGKVEQFSIFPNPTYKEKDYVMFETRRLAMQISKIKSEIIQNPSS